MPLKVIHILSGDAWGGAETQAALQLRALRELGCDANALLFNDLETAKKFREFGIPVHICMESAGLKPLMKGAVEKCRSVAPSVIVSHGYKEALAGVVCARACSAKHVCMIHGWSEAYTGLKRIKKAAYSWMFLIIARSQSAAVVTVSNALAKELRLEGRKNSHVIHNVADTSTEVRTSSLPRPGAIIVGRLVPVKRVDWAIEAFGIALSRIRGLQPTLYIIGAGPLENELKARVRKLHLETNIHFMGFRNDATALIGESKCLIISSESEGIPTVLLEAMIRGVPVVSSDLPGIREVRDLFPEYPLTIHPVGKIDSLASGIADVFQQRESTSLSKEIAAQVREYFSPMRAAKEHLSLYDTLTQT